jgi:hypothetical protein
MKSPVSRLLIACLIVGLVLFASLVFFPGIYDRGTGIDRDTASDADETVVNDTDFSNDADRDSELDTDYLTTSLERTPTYNSSDVDEPWFTEVGEKVGLRGLNVSNYFERNRQPLYKEGKFKSGFYVSDYNNDYKPDLLAVVNGLPILYENTGNGYGRSNALPTVNVTVTAAHFLDYDNDGWEDLYLLSNDGSVFLENKEGEFVRNDVGLDVDYESVRGAATADYTGNGCLDVFVVQANNWTEHRPEGYNNRNVTIGQDNGIGNRIFRGDCDGFEEATEEAGIEGTAWSLATSFVDFTNDGYPDIHVANDFNNDVVYINTRNGTFERRVLPNSTNRNGMSSEVAEVNGDGNLDIFVSNIYRPSTPVTETRFGGRIRGDNLLINQGGGRFVDSADEYGVRKSAGYGWSALLEDFDNDGYLDLFQTNSVPFMDSYPSIWDGIRDNFTRLNSSQAGLVLSQPVGAVSLDYDADGDLDIAASDATQRFTFYENRIQRGNSLRVYLRDNDSTTLGTSVEVITNGESWRRTQNSKSDYLSQSSRTLHFGIGNATVVDRLVVNWSNGGSTTYTDIETNQSIEVSESGGLRKELRP